MFFKFWWDNVIVGKMHSYEQRLVKRFGLVDVGFICLYQYSYGLSVFAIVVGKYNFGGRM